MDFLTKQQIVFNTSKKYEDVYIKLNEIEKIKYHQLFVLSAAIGFKNNKKVILKEKGREFRSSYLNTDQKTTMYSIVLNDPTLGKNIDKFSDKEFISSAKKTLEEYAEGGMELLVNKVFKTNFRDNILNSRYDEYVVDIISYVYQESVKIPF